MSAASLVIPYQKQSADPNHRNCGATCLSMVYSSLGMEVSQEEIWPCIARLNRMGSVASTTHLMALDAVQRGFSCLAVQAKHPLQALRQCKDAGLRVIVNHRLRNGSGAGHYSVLVDIDAESVVLHDTLTGPAQRMRSRELLELWMPLSPASEITGHLLIAIGKHELAAAPCQFCHTPFPAEVECPGCRKMVGLRPQMALGCVKKDCFTRLWQNICCPTCDHLWSYTDSVAPPAKARADLDLEKILSVLDQFTGMMAQHPAAANHPDVMKQLEFLAVNRQKLKSVNAQEQVRRTLVAGQLMELERAVEQKKQLQKKVMDSARMVRPLEPLDGNALGVALLRSLGLS